MHPREAAWWTGGGGWVCLFRWVCVQASNSINCVQRCVCVWGRDNFNNQMVWKRSREWLKGACVDCRVPCDSMWESGTYVRNCGLMGCWRVLWGRAWATDELLPSRGASRGRWAALWSGSTMVDASQLWWQECLLRKVWVTSGRSCSVAFPPVCLTVLARRPQDSGKTDCGEHPWSCGGRWHRTHPYSEVAGEDLEAVCPFLRTFMQDFCWPCVDVENTGLSMTHLCASLPESLGATYTHRN